MTRHDQIFIGIGSNIDPRAHVSAALERLASLKILLDVSSAYWAEPIGIPGADTFLNLAARVRWSGDLDALKTQLTSIEEALGRTWAGSAWASRTIDLDILLDGTTIATYGTRPNHVPHPDIIRFAHVAVPLADIAGNLRHPGLDSTLAEVAAGFPHHRLQRAEVTADA